jgi:hypothetical protein
MRICYKSAEGILNGKEAWETATDRRIILKYNI